MGSAIYTMWVEFPNPKAAEKALPKIEKFLWDMRKAEDDWQKLRNEGIDKVSHALTGGEVTYHLLYQRHRRVFDALGLPQTLPKDDPQLNVLAGELSSPYPASDGEDGIYDIEHLFEQGYDGRTVCFKGEVWHFADWDSLANAMKKLFGAICVRWKSDEYD